MAVPTFASSPKLPKDAPACAPPGTAPIFLSPMGEPFRATPGQPYPASWFAGADTDRDGAITRAEMVADAMRFFRQLDTNHDGRLTPDEVGTYESVVAPETSLFAVRADDYYEGKRRRGHETDAVGRSADYGGAMGAGRYAWLNIPEPVAAADEDIDRVVTAAEFATAAAKAFAMLDPVQRGRLKLADLPRTPQQISIDGPCRPPKARRGEAKSG